MGSGAYLVVLFLGAIVVVVDGQLILRTGPAYLSEVYAVQPARKLSLLVTVVFHLVMLGMVAVVASADLGADPGVPVIVRRLGVILLLIAAGHVLTIVGLSRLRQEQQETEMAEEQIHQHHDRAATDSRRAGNPVRSASPDPTGDGPGSSAGDGPDSPAAPPPPPSPQPATTRSTDPQTPGPRNPPR